MESLKIIQRKMEILLSFPKGKIQDVISNQKDNFPYYDKRGHFYFQNCDSF